MPTGEYTRRQLAFGIYDANPKWVLAPPPIALRKMPFVVAAFGKRHPEFPQLMPIFQPAVYRHAVKA